MLKRNIPVGLHPNTGGLVQTLLQRVAEGIAHAGAQPTVQGTDELLHRIASGICSHHWRAEKKRVPVETPVPAPSIERNWQSAAAAALLGLALVLLNRSLVVTQALEIGEDAGLRDLALEAAQSRLDAFVFADGDLGHKTGSGNLQFDDGSNCSPAPQVASA